MATSRLIPMHIGKNRTVSTAISDIIDYAENPQKTDNGRLISSYECDSRTADADFILSKRQYAAMTGRDQRTKDVLAYQIRQSFKPGEIDPETANRIGYELAMSFTKGKHQFIVATHIDKAHIHNHVIFNSTSLDCSRKFRDFSFSGRALNRLNDHICLANGLSIIEKPKRKSKSYNKWLGDKPLSGQAKLRLAIDAALDQKPADFEAFLRLMKEAGYAVKHGAHIKFTGPGEQRGTRCDTLKGDYTEQAIRERIAGTRIVSKRDNSSQTKQAKKLNLLIDIQAKIQEGKGSGYVYNAKILNVKQAAQTLVFLQENNIMEYEKLTEETALASKRFNDLTTEIKAKESRMAEIAELQKHISAYDRTKAVYIQYRKSGKSQKFFDEHVEALTLHIAAKKAFDKLKVEKIPTFESLQREYAALFAQKKKLYLSYREAKDKMISLSKAKANTDTLLNYSPAGITHETHHPRR